MEGKGGEEMAGEGRPPRFAEMTPLICILYLATRL